MPNRSYAWAFCRWRKAVPAQETGRSKVRQRQGGAPRRVIRSCGTNRAIRWTVLVRETTTPVRGQRFVRGLTRGGGQRQTSPSNGVGWGAFGGKREFGCHVRRIVQLGYASRSYVIEDRHVPFYIYYLLIHSSGESAIKNGQPGSYGNERRICFEG